MKIGAADFLEKPFDDEVLLASVRSALKQRDGEKKRLTERVEIDSNGLYVKLAPYQAHAFEVHES